MKKNKGISKLDLEKKEKEPTDMESMQRGKETIQTIHEEENGFFPSNPS